MTPAEVINRFAFAQCFHAHVCGNVLRIRYFFGPVIADLPITNGVVDAGYISYLLSEIE
jgi:hypothetical protein